MVPRLIGFSLTLLVFAAICGVLAPAAQPVQAPSRKPIAAPARRPPRPQSARPTLALQIGNSGDIYAMAFSPDGRTLATGSLDNTVRIWDVPSGLLKATMRTNRPTSWVLSPDGKTLATAGPARDNQAVRLWDAHSGRLTAVLHGHLGRVVTLAFSPDGKLLATGGEGRRSESKIPTGSGEARLWDTRSGKLKAVLPGHTQPVVTLAFSRDGKMLVTGSRDGTARLWDAASGKLKAALQGHTEGLFTVAFSPDGTTLATGSGGWKREGEKRIPSGEVRLWDVVRGRLQAILPRHDHPVFAVAFSPDGKTLAAGSEDRNARLWDVASGQLKATLSGHTFDVSAVAFSPDGQTLATGVTGFQSYPEELVSASFGRPGEARLWDVQSGQPRASLPGSRGAIAFSPDGKTLATGGDDRSVQLRDAETGQLKAAWRGRPDWVYDVAVSPDGKTLATFGSGGTTRLWDLGTGHLKAALRGHTDEVTTLAFSPNGNTVATGSRDSTVRLWDAKTGQPKAILQGHTGGMVATAFSPDGGTLATGSISARSENDRWVPAGEVRLWNAGTGQLKAILQGELPPVGVLVFSPDGQTLATGNGYTYYSVQPVEARLWDVTTGQLKAILPGPRAEFWNFAFSPDGRTLAAGTVRSGTENGKPTRSYEVRLFDTASGQLKASLPGSDHRAMALAFAPDGKTLATGGRDQTARLWDVATGRLKATLPASRSAVMRLAFSSDGRTLATASADQAIRRWEVATGRPIPRSSPARWIGLPPAMAHPVVRAGAAVVLHDPKDGRVLATMLPMPEVAEEAARARPIAIGAKAAPVGGGEEWFVATPEGYFDCSTNSARFIRWNVNGVLYPAERYLRRFRRPDLVRKALRGERITAPQISATDIPPAARFLGLRDGDSAPGELREVTIEARGVRDVKEVELLVNGRPLPPERARPIAVGAKPIELGAKDEQADYRVAQRFTFCVPLPVGAAEIHLRAVAYDVADLGSDPVELVLQRAAAKPVAGNLYVLSVGVSRYRNADGKGFKPLQFPAADARAMAERFQREGRPLYEQVRVRTLTDEQATAANVRAGLKWLQESVRPGQIDTAVIFLSGHGISVDGRYYFATHELDVKNIPATSLSGRELREALGGKLRAKAVFLFVDTCHAGGLSGRNDDLAIEVGEGVYVMASSGAKEYAYESESWGHGAFTLALLRALEKRELATNGVLHFNALAYAVPEEVAALMVEAGRNEGEQEPCVPLAARRLRVPIALAAR